MANVFRSGDRTWRVDAKATARGSERVHVERRGYASEAEAKRAAPALVAATLRRRGGSPGKPFASLTKRYLELERTRKRASSFDAEARMVRNHIGPWLRGRTAAQACSRAALLAFRSRVSSLPVSAETKSRIEGRFFSMLRYGASQGLLEGADVSRADGILLPFRSDGSEVRREKIALTKAQYAAFIATFRDDDKHKAMFES
ncbi:MAG: hypothetical protein LKG11_01660 [Bacilli bacterium]|jgi:hypothetical protein|nr:hypothetical protein [Bacilli bacterium]